MSLTVQTIKGIIHYSLMFGTMGKKFSKQHTEIFSPENRHSGSVARALPGGCGFDPWLIHTKDFKNGTSCSFAWRLALRKQS